MAYRQPLRAAVTGTGLLAAGLALAPARAQEPQSWYVGASTGDTHVEVFRGLGWEVGGSEPGFTVRGGREFHRNFELELAGLRTTDLQWSEYFSNTPGYLTAHTSFDVTALQANAVGKWHWGETFEGYVKTGLVQYQVSGRQVLDTLQTDAALTRDVDASGMDYLLGLGLAIKASPKWRVRVEYQYFGLDRDFLGVGGGSDPSIDTFSIGLDYALPREAAVSSSQ
ncbi:MAG TPA: outer membrane beta-barrel protein [Gammaproteobacteria bacterium]|nr:outer membrane beta-barrel protein [Gammaproteobacteria bacterium]